MKFRLSSKSFILKAKIFFTGIEGNMQWRSAWTTNREGAIFVQTYMGAFVVSKKAFGIFGHCKS